MSYNLDPTFPVIGPLVAELMSRAQRAIVVGWREPRAYDTMHMLLTSGLNIWLIDAWGPNMEHFKALTGNRFKNVVAEQKDVRDLVVEPQDLVIWQHGPEHLEKADAISTIGRLQSFAPVGVILESPVGPYPQGVLYGNPFEVHLSEWHPRDYKELGFVTADSVEKSQEGPHIIAVWSRQ